MPVPSDIDASASSSVTAVTENHPANSTTITTGTPSTTNSFSLPLNIIGSPGYSKGTYTENGETINMIKCPEGYVFEGSGVLFENNEDRGILKYDSNNHWLKEDGTPHTTHTNNLWTNSPITCKRKYCDPNGIVDSDREYAVLIDDDDNSSTNVTCNDGYVFDTKNHKMGKVKCGIIPEMTNDLSKDTEVGWIVDDPIIQEKCESKNMDQCNNDTIDYIISEDVNQDYASNTASGTKQLKCTWVPDISANSNGNKSGLSRSGYCKFIHRADFNKSDPICRSMYCSKKEVLNSDRIDGASGALPGPDEGAIHGSCVNFDGQILEQINNSSDCACFKHKSCDVCTSNDNCQWCGYSTSSGNRGEGGFCYSTKTHLSICDTSVRSDRGGTCTHVKTSHQKQGEPSNGWSQTECESNVCVRKSYWDALSTIQSSDDESSNTNYKTDKNTREQCEIDNKLWDNNAVHQAPNRCILTNQKNKPPNQPLGYYPHMSLAVDGTDVKFNIEDKICVAKRGTTLTKANLAACQGHISKTACDLDSARCEWITNPLRDSLFKWSNDGDNRIHFTGSGTTGNSSNCPIRYTTNSNNNTDKIIFKARNNNDGFLHLEADSTSGINDPPKYNDGAISSYLPAIPSANNPNLCQISDIEYKIFSSSECTNVMGTSGSSVTHHTTPHTCDDGIKYCGANDKAYDGTPACPQNYDDHGLTIAGCPYYETAADLASANQPDRNNYKCYGNLSDYKCTTSGTDPYNCSKTIPQQTGQQPDSSVCENTGYVVSTPTGTTQSPLNSIKNYALGQHSFKDYIICSTDVGGSSSNSEVEQKRCENIGSKYAHWGQMCRSGNDEIPQKQICELLSSNDTLVNNFLASFSGATWGKFINRGISPNKLEWGCYKDNSDKYTGQELCDIATALSVVPAAGSGASPRILTDGGSTSLTFSNVSQPKCIIDGVDKSPGLDLILELTGTEYNTTGTNSGDKIASLSELQNICTSGVNHNVAFDFVQNQTGSTITGQCVYSNTANVNYGQGTQDTRETCETANNTWVKHYNYVAGNTCTSIGESRLSNQADIPTTWTGGEIVNDDGIHRSECSPSIMSSCNVDCNSGYGGGGEYICQYNSAGGDVCETINQKVIPNKATLCTSQSACVWDSSTSTCSHNTNFANDGHLEWIGSPCYKIDNTAFSHGIAKLPDLDKVIPPFGRAFIIGLITLVISAGMIYLGSNYMLWLVGWFVDKPFNIGFKGINKLIKFTTSENKILNLFTDSRINKNEKAVIIITAVVMFVGSYFIFDYVKESIRESSDGPSVITKYWNKIKHFRVKLSPPPNVPLGDHLQTAANDAANNVNQRIGILFSDDAGSGTPTEEEDTLTMIVQVSVLLLVALIIVVFAIRGDDQAGILKKINENNKK